MKVLAIDPSSQVLGYAVLNGEILLDYGIIDVRKMVYEKRFMGITLELESIIKHYQVEAVACESAVRFKGKRLPALEVAVIAIQKYVKRFKLPITMYAPAEWKVGVAKRGDADKLAVHQIVSTLYPGFPKDPTEMNLHMSDAIGIGLHHQRRQV